jgi:hypothetical protein
MRLTLRNFTWFAVAALVVSIGVLVGCWRNGAIRYSLLINDWRPTGLITHFPKPLPATASNIRISAFPGFLQGGAWFQVRMTLPTAQVSKVYADAANFAKDFYDGGGRYSSVNSKTNGLPGTSFLTSDNNKQSEFTADYRIFVFAAQSRGGIPPFQSGKSCGVVISRQRNEVIYFAENW